MGVLQAVLRDERGYQPLHQRLLVPSHVEALLVLKSRPELDHTLLAKLALEAN